MIVTHKKRRFHGLLAGVLAAALILPSLGYGASSGSFDDDDMAPPPKKVVKPKPVVTPEDKKSEGSLLCPDGKCKTGLHKDETIKPISPTVYSPTQREACYRNHLLQVAKTQVSRWYGNRDHSIGDCAKGVRSIMGVAGMNPLGALGDAYHFKRDGKLKQLGFKDIYYPGMRPDQAPPGAILIFRGPLTYETNGVLPPRRSRGGRGAGNWVGHVSIKGDNGFYYTDGRTSYPAVGNRFLAGVFVPDSGRMFSPWVKQKCGDT